MAIRILIENGSNVYDVTGLLEGEAILTEEVNCAGQLVFSVIRDGVIDFQEGNRVELYEGETCLFVGWVMQKKRTQEQIITVTAYDQIYYLIQNRADYAYSNKTASDIVRMIGTDFGMELGTVDDSGWIIPQRIEESQSLLDIICNAMALSETGNGKRLFLFDRGGKLCFQTEESLKTQKGLRCDGTISGYDYQTDISKDTYNAVFLKQTGTQKQPGSVYKKDRTGDVEKWGRLEYFSQVDRSLNESQLKEMAEGILAEKCRVNRTLTVENLNGEEMVWPGESLYIEIQDLGDISLQEVCLVQKAKRIYRNGEIRMQVTVEVEA